MLAFASGSRKAVAHLVYSVRRRTTLRGPRLGTCAALAVVALVAGGLLGVLLAFFALVLVVDAVLPMPGHTWSEADDRFSRLVRQRRRARLRRRLRRLRPDDLDVLDDGAGWAAVAERRALGVEPISLDSIGGTVESMKARSFDGHFRPDRSSSEHWKRLWMAQARGAALPPISVYRVDGSHVVRDGHHRVSVARDHGMSTIDAEIVELLRAGIDGRGERRSGAEASG
jgi:hypothetical protein